MSVTLEAQVLLDNLDSSICCPFFNKSGTLHVLFSDTGQIGVVKGEDEGVEEIHNTDGQPSYAAFSREGALYITDFTHGAVLVATDPTESTQTNKDFRSERQDLVVSVYEDKPLKGPGSLAFDSNGNIFFTDSGPLGDTGLHNPSGSLFMISGGNSTNNMMMLKPISLENLAYPSDIALSNNDKMIYVTEMMTNRLLRFFQKPEGVYHGHVLYQNQGGIGPSCVAVDPLNGNIYVGIYI